MPYVESQRPLSSMEVQFRNSSANVRKISVREIMKENTWTSSTKNQE
jgi:hypothetical protein